MDNQQKLNLDRGPEKEPNKIEVFCRYIVKNGKRIYPKNAEYFHFWVERKPPKS